MISTYRNLFSQKDLAPLINKIYKKFNKFKFQDNLFLVYWCSIELGLIVLYSVFSIVIPGKKFFPRSVLEFFNSFWFGSIIFSSSLAMILLIFFDLRPSISNIIHIEGNFIKLINSKFFSCVFSCKPPVLHNKNDFSRFITNFSPLSIEIHLEDSLFYFVLFGSDKNSFDLKAKECYNQLCSLYSEVKMLDDKMLEKFILTGFNSKITFGEDFERVYTLEDLKSLRSERKDLFEIIGRRNKKESTHSSENKHSIILPLIGSQGKNSLDKKNKHMLRGMTINEIAIFPSQSILSTYIGYKQLKTFLSLGLRLPNKDLSSIPVLELEKIYFFFIHKNLNYTFHEIENIVNKLPNPEISTDNNKSVLINPNSSTYESISGIDEKNELTTDFQSFNNNSYNSKMHFEKEEKKANVLANFKNSLNDTHNIRSFDPSNQFVDLKKVFFQFSPFCNYFCPKINDEFKKKSEGMKNNFNIPTGCYDHVLLSNTNFNEFFINENIKLPLETIFTNNFIKEKFLHYVREKDLALIDKVCHFSSIILLSKNGSSVDLEEILNFINDLGENYFK